MFKPLEGLKVIDITEGVAGPFASQYLGDLGADVIKVERFEGDWGRTLGTLKYNLSTQYMALNRNKRNISLNYKTLDGKVILLDLIKSADIVITSFRPGVTEKYGLGYEAVKEINPSIIYGRISGYGYKGPLAKKMGVDTVIQAVSGVMNYIGPPDGDPYRIGFAVIDQVAARDLVTGILAMYIQYLKTGEVSSSVDVSLFATAAVLQSQQWQDYLETGNIPFRVGNKNPVIVPSAVYLTEDNKFISVAAVRDDQFVRLCKIIEREDLINDPRFKNNNTRVENRNDLEEVLTKEFKKRSQKEWETVLEANNILVAPVNNLEDIKLDEQLFNVIPKTHYKFNDDGNEITAIGAPFFIKDKCISNTIHPPALQGQHSLEILKELGYTDAQVMELIQNGDVKSLSHANI